MTEMLYRLFDFKAIFKKPPAMQVDNNRFSLQ